jgi:ABC-2 type transport system permease protein
MRPHLIALGIGAGGVGEVVLLVFGIMSITQEFRFRTDTASFLVTPRRGQLVAAKLVAVALSGAVFAALSIALVVPLSMILVTMKGGTVIWDRQVAQVLVAILLVLMLYGPIGIAVGALVRNQIGAIAGSLVWLMVVEQILIALFPGIGRWTPGGATTGVLQLGRIATSRGDMLPAWGAALLLAAYAGLTAHIGTHWTLRRDIT